MNAETGSPARLADNVPHDDRSAPTPGLAVALLVSVFVIGACGLVYELIAAALASYLLGDSVLQFSTVIGAYLFAMGIGSWLSRWLSTDLPGHFIRIELLVGFIGGLLPVLLFVQHSFSPEPFRLMLYLLVLAVGLLVGLEVPLVMRLLRRTYRLRDLISQVLTFDYLGALVVSLAFPLFFVPQLGMIRTGLFFGLTNVLVAGWSWALFKDRLASPWSHLAGGMMVASVLVAAFIWAGDITHFAERQFYGERIVLAESSKYQRIVITQSTGVTRLYLNGNLQFSSDDEYRYHEALVLPALAAHSAPSNVLILGGGDGLVARQLLRDQRVKRISLVDLDPRVTNLFSTSPALTALNEASLTDPKVQVINADAYEWVKDSSEVFDLIIVDLPDPTNLALGKLYSQRFYQLLGTRVTGSGFIAVQTTSPLYARRSFWSVATTLEAAGLQTRPYHAVVPSFGEWGFILAGHRPYPDQAARQRLSSWPRPDQYQQTPRFMTPDLLAASFVFPADMARLPVLVNRMHEPALVEYYQSEWGQAQN